MLSIVLALSILRIVSSQTTVEGNDGDVWNCPTTQTISTAYYAYCPASGPSDASGAQSALQGIITIANYFNTPTNFQVNSGDFEFGCSYNAADAFNGQVCYYSGGGGNPLTRNEANFPNQDVCPTLSQVVPQPSPGVNYRKRATVGAVPQFDCPQYSQQGVYLLDTTVQSGNLAPGATGSHPSLQQATTTDIAITCGITNKGSCVYLQDTNGQLSFAGGVNNNGDRDDAFCPTTLCTALYTGTTNMKRGIYQEESQMQIAKRQVNTRRLRERLAKKRQLS